MPNEKIKSEIPTPPTYYPPSPQKKKGKILGIVIGVIVLAVIGVGSALATRIWDPLWSPFRPEPAEVIEKMSAGMRELKTVHWRTKIDARGREDTEDIFNFSTDFTTDTDNTDPQNPKSAGEFYITFDIIGEAGLALAGEVKTIDKDSYLKLTIVPPIPISEFPIDLSQLEDQWIKIDEQSIKSLIEGLGVPISPEGKKLYLVKREFPDKEIRGVKTYHYLVALNKEEVKKLLAEMIGVYFDTLMETMLGTMPEEFRPSPEEIELEKKKAIEDIKGDINEFFEKISEITAELWIGKKDLYLYKIKGEKEIDLAKFDPTIEGKIMVKFDIDFSDFNQPVTIEVPEEYKTLEEILEGQT